MVGDEGSLYNNELEGLETRRFAKYKVNALTLERAIETDRGIHMPHNRIHAVLKGMGLARDEPRKQRRRKWVRYERRYSNSMWHTDWTLIEGRGWLIAYLEVRRRLWRVPRGDVGALGRS